MKGAYDKEHVKELLKRYEGLPRKEGGRIDYSGFCGGPCVMGILRYKDELLLMKRAKGMAFSGTWGAVSGYIDYVDSVEKVFLLEKEQETGIDGEVLAACLESIILLERIVTPDARSGRDWYKYPVVATFHTRPPIRLNHEHTEYRWRKSEEVWNYSLHPPFERTLKQENVSKILFSP